MVDNIFQIENTFLLAGPDGLFDRVEDHRCGHRRCDPPAQDPPGVGIDHDSVPAPKPALDKISRTHCGRVCDRGLAGFASGGTGQTQFGHQPLDGAARHRNPNAG
jgi:hypothetical protein